MQVILRQDVKGIGRRGELHEVKDGYARNFLIARGLAKPATPEHMAQYRRDQEHNLAEQRKTIEGLEANKNLLESKPMEITLKTGKHNEVFDSVNKQRIKEYCASLGIDIHQDNISLDHAIKEKGKHRIEIKLGKNIDAQLTIIVA